MISHPFMSLTQLGDPLRHPPGVHGETFIELDPPQQSVAAAAMAEPSVAAPVDQKDNPPNNFKLHMTFIELLIRRTIHQTLSGFHDIISCIFLTNQDFTFCLHILINMKLIQQISRLKENSHYIHQCQISVGNNNSRECIMFEKMPQNCSRVQTSLFRCFPSKQAKAVKNVIPVDVTLTMSSNDNLYLFVLQVLSMRNTKLQALDNLIALG